MIESLLLLIGQLWGLVLRKCKDFSAGGDWMLNLGGTVKARDLSALWNAVFQLQGLSALAGHKEAENGKEPHRVLMRPG